MNLSPTGSNIVVQKHTTSGFSDILYMPDGVKDQYYKVTGTVIAVGPGEVLANGEREPMGMEPGDKIILWPGVGLNKEVDISTGLVVIDVSECEGIYYED